MSHSLEDIAIAPVHFFPLRIAGRYCEKEASGKKFLLPDTSALCNQTPFASVHFGWNEKGLHFLVHVKQKAVKSFFPNVSQGDSFEVMIDTRDVKTGSFNTRFCHHFFCLPESVDGEQVGEITHFRTEDAHELCSSDTLLIDTKISPNSYKISLFIPKESLFGYDPEQFDRLGLTYRVNRYHGEPQDFSVTSETYQVDQNPALWSQVRLIK